MSEAKIEFAIGAISFVGEGDKDWVASQLDKILDRAPELVKLAPQEQATEAIPLGSQQPEMEQDNSIAQTTLATFLRDKGATRTQVNKFLATAIWLTAQGKNRLTTGDVTQALRDSNQTRLRNASECLNQNVTKGFCEKVGREFFVTQEGKASL